MTPPAAQPAATVIIARDAPDGLEVLMLKRNSAHAFGGMWVFPGGKVDPHDADASRPDDELLAARNAAAREAHEEAGIRVHAPELVALSHWTPPPEAPRRFTTWFFLAPAPPDCDVTIDGEEIHEHVWITPSGALERAARTEIEVVPPTWMTLRGLAAFPDVAACMAAVRDKEPVRFATKLGRVDGIGAVVWEGDAGYDDGDLDRPGPRNRLVMVKDGAWRYEGPAAP